MLRNIGELPSHPLFVHAPVVLTPVLVLLALALAVGLAFPLLDLAGFADGAANGPAALWTLIGLYSLAPVIFKAFAIVLMWRYPITADRQAATRQRLERDMEQAKAGTPDEATQSEHVPGSPVRDSGM